MAKVKGDLKSALRAVNEAPRPPEQRKEAVLADQKVAPSRRGKLSINGWFDPSVRSSIRQIQVTYPQKGLQDLLAEALNLLFAKYNVPETAYRRPSE